MILIIGRSDDPPITMALQALQEQGAPHQFLELRTLAQDGLQFDLQHGQLQGWLRLAGQRLPLSEVRAIYARLLSPGSRWASPQQAQTVSARAEQLLHWLDVAPCLVVNRPSAMNTNNAKPMQAHWIAASGFAVPETLVSSDAQEVQAFRELHGRVIYKSISGVRSIVRELTEADLPRLQQLRQLPVQFQALVPGEDVRVHVVGSQCLAASIACTAVDYRYGRGEQTARLRPTDLPAEVQARCLTLARELGLSMAGIDLRRTPDGSWVCFEVNPMPAYSYYESHTGLPISTALARCLMAADSSSPEDAHHEHASDGEPHPTQRPRAELGTPSLA
ncbi:RimK family alpha-L-glutamate ligase [Roseateles sp. BYS180W]|uniref:RimK family alpha-L-glutamate ligase n=1 Tax=Roseateles rivi TaxID=3299028 RepID=A0ABW7FT40_9BURK